MGNFNQLKTIREFANELSIYLRDNVPQSSGKLADSIKSITTDKGLEIEAEGYFDFIETGINGTEFSWGSPYSFTDKMPPISSLIDYAEQKGINVYALQKSIFKKGIAPMQIITPTFDERTNEFGDNYIVAVWDDFAAETKRKDKTIK